VTAVGATGCRSTPKTDDASPVPSASSKPASALTKVHTSQNGLAVAHFPADFRVSDAAMGKKGSIIRLERADNSVTLEILADAEPPKPMPWDAEKAIHDFELAAWGRTGAVEEGVERSDGKCIGHDAVIAVRKVSVRGKPTRHWTCTFVHEGHIFRLMSWVSEARAADEPELRKILEATEVR
jgi:hypothetical protein